jgi:hypothetical protein
MWKYSSRSTASTWDDRHAVDEESRRHQHTIEVERMLG